MKYLLRILALGDYPEVEIDKEKYDAILRSKEALANGLAMEEKYEILISNYLDFEKKLLSCAADAMVRRPYDYEDFFEVRMEFNIKLVNLLTAARLYQDQLHRHIRAIIPEVDTIKEDIKRLFSEEYDQHPEYRFIEELRDYVQHWGIPVHWTKYSAHADDSGKERLLIYTMELASQKVYLKGDKKFKQKVLEEIPDDVDLKVATRVYIESMSRVHSTARNLVDKVLKESRSIIEFARSEYKNVYPDRFVGLSVLCHNGRRVIENSPIILEWDDIRLKLTRRNAELVNLHNRYVIGRSKT